MSLILIPTKLLFSLSWHTVNLFSQCESQLTTLSLYVYPAGTWFFAFLGREQIRNWWSQNDVLFPAHQQICISMCSCPNWSRCPVSSMQKLFTGLSYRPLETRDGVSYLSSPSLYIQSASVCAKQSKFPE